MLRFIASERGIKNLDITWKNIVTDYGATSGGSGLTSDGSGPTSDYTAFKAFHDWALLQSGWVGLELPPSPSGKFYGVNGSYTFQANYPFFGIPQLVVMGYGARMNGLHGGSLLNKDTERAPIYTVSAGSRTLQLKDSADASIFTAGNMILVAGLDLQGFGYPPNPHFFEWRRIESIVDDVITLTEPLTNTYKDHWPDWFTGNAFEIGGFGAATIARTLNGWDCHHKIYGLESYKPGNQTYYFVRQSELFDVVSPDNGWIIGASQTHKIVNQNHSTTNHEVDKLCENALIGEYPSNRNIHVQSSSVQFMEVRGGTRTIEGCAKNMVIRDGYSPSIKPGVLAYGNMESLVVRNHRFDTWAAARSAVTENLNETFYYEGDGVFRWLRSNPPQGLIPGAVAVLGTGTPFHLHTPFRILDQVQDDDGLMIVTSLEGATLPEVTGRANVSVQFLIANLTVENCTGCPEALELSQVPANSPYGIFRQRTLDGTASNTGFGLVLGRMQHIKVNVLTPYTGVAGTLNLTIGGQFGSYVINPDMTESRYQSVRVNLKVAGERVITPSGVTGAQSGDTNLSDFTGDIWLPGGTNFGVYIGNGSSPVNITGESPSVYPSVTVEVLTDQEIPSA